VPSTGTAPTRSWPSSCPLQRPVRGAARRSGAAWRPVPAEVRLERVFVFKYPCKVPRDHTIRLAGRVLQLPPGRGERGYAGRLVEVHVQLDGSIVAFDGPRELAVRGAPPEPVQLRAQDRLNS